MAVGQAQRGIAEVRQPVGPIRAGRPAALTTPGRPLRTQAEPARGTADPAGRDRVTRTPTRAANSSGVGVPRTTRNNGSSSDMPGGYDDTSGAPTPTSRPDEPYVGQVAVHDDLPERLGEERGWVVGR